MAGTVPPPLPPSPHPVPGPRALIALLSRSILPTAFLGTAVIFTCFTLSALYARRRSYLYLGGEGGRGVGGPRAGEGGGASGLAHHLVRVAGFLFSGLSLMFLFSLVNLFVGSTWLFTVSPAPGRGAGIELGPRA